MITINNKTLLAEKISFDAQGYTKKAMPAVLEVLKQYIATGKYPYNAQVRDFILSLCTIDANLHDYLETEVYLAQQDLRKENESKLQQEMADKGFIPAKEWKGYVGLAQLVGNVQLDWMTSNIDKIGKIVVTNDGEDGFFIPKGKRTRGYYLRSLNNAFYKPI